MRKVNIVLDEMLWRQFRVACIEHNTSASKQLGRLIAEQISQWERERDAHHDDPEHHGLTP